MKIIENALFQMYFCITNTLFNWKYTCKRSFNMYLANIQ